MVDVLVDPEAAEPLHRQVYRSIRGSILAGEMHPGERVLPSRGLADKLSLSRTTITQAYDQLLAEGYLEARTGSGTYVAGSLPAEGPMLQPAESSRVELSSWGRRLAGYRGTSDRAERSYQYDFRPQRIDTDSFPWEDWRAATERAQQRRETFVVAPPPAGHAELREAISQHVARYRAVRCSREQVVVVNGSQQGLNLLMRLLLDPGERVAVEDPGYLAARHSFESARLEVTSIPVDAGGMNIEALRDTGPHRMVHVTPSHQYPTGVTMPLSRRLALLQLSERDGSLVIEDDYDSEFRYEGQPVESLQGLDRTGRVIYAGTFSKSTLPGLRLGFVILPSRLVEAFVAAKALWDSGSPVLEQAVLAEFMTSGDFERHIRRMRRLYRSRRDALMKALQDELGSRATPSESQGGLNLLVQLNTRLPEARLVERAVRAGLGLHSAAPYYKRAPANPTFLFGFGGIREEQISQGIKLLESLL
ncbi:MAG: PLP-dependent aminotransferase family protein [Chloroflexota bacterium]